MVVHVSTPKLLPCPAFSPSWTTLHIIICGRVVREWIVQWPCKLLLLPPSLVVVNLHLHGPSWRVTIDATTVKWCIKHKALQLRSPRYSHVRQTRSELRS